MNKSFDKNPPIKLQPSIPAKNHLLSHTDYSQQILFREVHKKKQNYLNEQINKMSAKLKLQENEYKQQISQKHQHILKLSIELNRQHEIQKMYQYQLKQFEERSRMVERQYSQKVQLLKEQIKDEYQKKIALKKEQTVEDLKRLSKVYNEKIALISLNKHQDEYALQGIELKQKIMEIEILEEKIREKQKKIQFLTTQKSVYEKKMQEYEMATENYEGKLQLMEKQHKTKFKEFVNKITKTTQINQSLLQRNKGLIKENEKLREEFLKQKNQFENLSRVYQVLEKQHNQMNRKTYKNKDKQNKEDYDERKHIGDHSKRMTQREGMNKGNSQYLKKINELEQILQQKQTQQIQNEQKKSEIENKLRQLSSDLIKKDEIIEQKNTTINEMNLQVKKNQRQYKNKIEIFQRNMSFLEKQTKKKEQELGKLLEKIENQYLGQISSLKDQKTELNRTLQETHEMIETMAKKKGNLDPDTSLL